MFSTRCLVVLALAAAASSLPAQEKPIPQPITTITNDEFAQPMPGAWFNVPFIGDLTKIFSPLWKLFPSFEDLGPRILIDDSKFQVIVQVKDYKKSDLKVKVKGDFILVQGSHEAKVQEDHDLFASQFLHTYTLPSNSSAASVTAEITSDGYLIISAPISGPVDRSKEIDRDVPIVSTGTPYKKEEKPEVLIPEVATPEVATSEAATPEVASPEEVASGVVAPEAAPVEEASPEEDRKEPTTIPPERDATENAIPHGNEVSP